MQSGKSINIYIKESNKTNGKNNFCLSVCLVFFVIIVVVVFCFSFIFAKESDRRNINSLKLGMSVSESLDLTFNSAKKYLSWNSIVGSDQLRGGPL